MIHPGQPTVPKKDVREKIAKLYKTTPDVVIPYGFESKIGGMYIYFIRMILFR